MDSNQHHIELANRILSYREYGDPEGKPIFFFHGHDSSSLAASFLDEAAKERNIRIIAPDRPGFGGSSMSPKRRITDWPRDITVLLNNLDLDQIGIIAFSAGAPYAYACGNSISRRIANIGICSGIVPGENRVLSSLAALSKAVTIPLKSRSYTDPEVAERSWQTAFAAELGAEHAASLNPDFRRIMVASAREAYREGSGGLVKDFGLTAKTNWGFAMGNVLADRVYVWHGDADNRVPVAKVRHLVERLPHCEVTVKPAEGHFSTWVNHYGEILTTVAQF